MSVPITPTRQFSAWLVHALTASTAVMGLLTLWAIQQESYVIALAWMTAAVFIDAVDGTLARLMHAKTMAPSVDGALLDNMMDYLNYVITPAFLLLMHPDLLLEQGRFLLVSTIVLVSAYQFTQRDAKTKDHFFKGFPCYWNIVVFYLLIFHSPAWLNTIILLILAVLIFVPIKYVYPSRLDYLTRKQWLRRSMLYASIVYGFVSVALLFTYPATPLLLISYSGLYISLYLAMSVYRTYYPLH